MDTYAFNFRLHDPLSDTDADRLYDAFDEEVAVESGPKGHWVGFERQADSFLDAVLSAISEVIRLGFEPLAVEDELVSMADIAERTGRTRQSVSMLFEGARGAGDFPAPAAGNVRSPLWHWADVAAWFDEDEGKDVEISDRGSTLAAVNGALAGRLLSREQPDQLKRIREAIAG